MFLNIYMCLIKILRYLKTYQDILLYIINVYFFKYVIKYWSINNVFNIYVSYKNIKLLYIKDIHLNIKIFF